MSRRVKASRYEYDNIIPQSDRIVYKTWQNWAELGRNRNKKVGLVG